VDWVGFAIPLSLGFLILLHHKIKKGIWIEKHDVDNHETIALTLISFAFGYAVGVVFFRCVLKYLVDILIQI